MRNKDILKDAVVLLIVLVMVLSTIVVTGTGEPQGAVLDVTTNKTLYILGEPVTIFLTNVGDETLSAGGPIITIYDSEDEIVYQEACYCWYELEPGEYVIWPAWDQTNQQGDQVPVGCYVVEGFLSGYDGNYVDDATFFISDDDSFSPPDNPDTPTGPTVGDVGVEYNYCTSTTDPNGDNVYYWFDWDDGSNSGWIGPYSSGESGCESHSWSVGGVYCIKSKAKDDNGEESGWSQALGVIIENGTLIVNAGGPYEGNIMEDIEFDGTATGGIPPYEFFWDYGDGNTSSGDPHPTHNYGNAGNYTVILTVTDSEDDTANDATWAYINAPPNPPIIDGPNSGKPETLYTYTFTSTDPDGDDIAEYIINWGDGPNETITGPFISGTPQTKGHTWDSQGTYTIKAKARDVYGVESDWSTLEVSMPKTKAFNIALFLQRFFQRFPFFEKILNQIV